MAQKINLTALQSLTKDELIELILRQQERLEQLEQQVAELLRAGKRQAAPFGRQQPKAEPKQAGRKAGQGRFAYRPTPAPATVTATRTELLTQCPCCGDALSDPQQHEHYESDIPPVQPVITRYITQSGYCKRCARRHRSQHPEQLSTATGAAGVSVGPHAIALAADLKHRLGLSYEKTSELLLQAFNLKVSRGALCQTDQRLASKAEGVYEELVTLLRLSAQAHVDETGWRIGGLSAWLWVFTNRHLTVYGIGSGQGQARSHKVVVQMLGEKFAGTLISDCFSAYDHEKFAGWIKQKCIGHLLKELSHMEDAKAGRAMCFARDVTALLRGALILRDHKAQLQAPEFKRQALELESQLDALIDPHRRFSDADNQRFAKRLRKQRQHLLRFLYVDGVDATNNRAERMLRPAVLVRKTGGCNRTAQGARDHAVLTSIAVTARQHGLNPAEVLLALQCAGTRTLSSLIPTLSPAVVTARAP